MGESVELRGPKDWLGVNCFISDLYMSIWAPSLLLLSSHHAAQSCGW